MIFEAFADMIEIGMKETKKVFCCSEQAVLDFVQGRRKRNVKLRRRAGEVPAESGD